MAKRTRTQAKARTQFDIGLGELDVIEEALRYQANSLSLKALEAEEAESDEKHRSRMTAIQSVLGQLHNQKVWFVPKESVPLG